ncbi:histidine phosphatase family protein [Candidatus Acetothermia bacterium]|nr:histidine phosphatase family protein [Candidatus Acetothermia bacterium]MBI3644334.1 histidine phosphatase family protein [Candidatus Acetothermia bacterium]
MCERNLYLVRHGYHDSGDVSELGGSLTPLGVEQSQIVAKRLKSLPITAIHSSNLLRAIETATIIQHELRLKAIQQSSDLAECLVSLPPSLIARAPHLSAVSPEIIESGKRQAERAFNRYFIQSADVDVHEVIVCHGNIIRYFVCRALNLPLDVWPDLETANCGITQICIGPKRISLCCLNDTGHLPSSLVMYI